MTCSGEGRSCLSRCQVPVIFRGCIRTWPAGSWTPRHVSRLLQDQPVRLRIGLKNTKEIQWEGDCDYVSVTVSEFLKWQEGEEMPKGHPLEKYSTLRYWAYLDYKYMASLFEQSPSALNSVDWSVFGLPVEGVSDSAMWLGSAGAYTPTHYDTYGCNLVAQIHGRKEWLLTPPGDYAAMSPTRQPYEESSVFSPVNLDHPDFKRFPHLKGVQCYRVCLQPGDVLYVPRHWWHAVKCLDTALTINMWVILEEDAEERLQEAITRFFTCRLLASEDPMTWLNPTESLTPDDVNLDYITKCLKAVMEDSDKTKNTCASVDAITATSVKVLPKQLSSNDEIDCKKIKLDVSKYCDTSGEHNARVGFGDKLAAECSCDQMSCIWHRLSGSVSPVTSFTLGEHKTLDNGAGYWSDEAEEKVFDVKVNDFQDIPKPSAGLSSIDVLHKTLVDCVMQPDVIKLISEKLKAKC